MNIDDFLKSEGFNPKSNMIALPKTELKRMLKSFAKKYHEQQVKTCAIQIVTCCGFSVGDKVNTPYSEGEVWKVTETSVHVKHWDEKREAWMFSKYLTEPYHHSQNPVTVLSHCR